MKPKLLILSIAVVVLFGAGLALVRILDKSTATQAQNTEQQRSLINANIDEQFQLKIGQSAVMRSESLEIKFLDVAEDSRCRSDVLCIWPGKATIIISVLKNGANARDFNLTTGPSENLSVKTFNGYSIKLIKLDPYPKSTQKIAPSEYIATLVVKKSNI